MLDEVLKDRNTINQALREIVDSATEAWGVKIEMVEMKDVEIPEAMQRAMAREAEAVRKNGLVSLKRKRNKRQRPNYPMALDKSPKIPLLSN